ncbi:MAG TPA: hypothetical protein VFQ67_08865 [Allosphingosinicella sp.]|jgi:hypothetical protein|nr:hypothetical protein [Allosphingosinicella sp.]
MSLIRGGLVLAIAAAALPGAASACLPPPDDWRPPTLEEQARAAFEDSTDIVYGVVTDASVGGGKIAFKVLHVYKGPLRPGARLKLYPNMRVPAGACLNSYMEPPARRGDRGVIFFNEGRPALNFLYKEELDMMFAKGWIRSARRPAAAVE